MNFFPTYCQAGCFGLSRDVVKDILAVVPETRYFYQPQKYIRYSFNKLKQSSNYFLAEFYERKQKERRQSD